MHFTLTIIEKHLGVLGGHHQTQLASIEALCSRHIINVITSHDTNIAQYENFEIEPILSSAREQRKRHKWAVEHDVDALEKLAKSKIKLANSPALFPTAEYYDFKMCLAFLARNPNTFKFYLRVLICETIDLLSGPERAKLLQYVKAGSITLLTETKSLVELLHTKHDLTAHNVFLLPCSISPNDSVQRYETDNRSYFKIGYLGGFRKEKGSDKLPAILSDLKALINSSDNITKLEFVMQKGKHRSGLKRLLYDFRLHKSIYNSKEPDREIKLITLGKELSPKAFVAAIKSVDILLIPYELEAYHARGSGIIIDGVLAGKPIIYSDGIGMSEFLGFGNAATAADIAEFAPKIMTMVQNFEAYRAKTPLAREAMRAQIQKSADFLASL